jgi:glucose-6-phosphate isomerase
MSADIPALISRSVASRISQRDTSIFSADDPAVREAVGHRLGWIGAPSDMAAHLGDLTSFADQVRADGLTDIYLIGSDGSSLAAEVLRDVPIGRSGPSRLVVLDTTDERTVRAATNALVPEQALFLVVSTSGTEIDVSALERHFWNVVSQARPGGAGAHFTAVTNPDTPLARLAVERGYRRIFLNPADIGERYAALSLPGLVPAALLGIDLAGLLESARQMRERCQADTGANPGLALGAFMASEAAAGRNKLTLLLPPTFTALGPWIEQLVAESTGKAGRGVLPIIGEPIGAAEEYGRDRAFVAILLHETSGGAMAARRLEAAGHPVFRIRTEADQLGGEFYRWEFATALAGVALGINPFDEPDVDPSSARALAHLEAYRANGAFTLDPSFDPGPGYERREHRGADVPNGAGRYLAVLDYLSPNAERAGLITRLRRAVRRRSRIATTYGIGPRYLHTTGQYHKGGPNTGTFLILTAADAAATPVANASYTFSALKQAQALGDFDALAAAGRTVIHYHFETPDADLQSAIDKVVRTLW